MRKNNEKNFTFNKKTASKKVYAGFSLFVLCILVLAGISGALTRTINGSYDENPLYIRTSEGNKYEASATNILSAVANLSSDGTIWIPKGVYTFEEDIDLTNNKICLVLEYGCELKASETIGDAYLIELDDNDTVCGGKITYGYDGDVDYVLYINGDNVTIKDVVINGGYVGIRVDGKDTIISDCDILNFYSSAIKMMTGSNNTWIERCKLRSMEANSPNCYYINQRYGDGNTTISSCDFYESNGSTSSDAWIQYGDTPDNMVAVNNVIRGNFVKVDGYYTEIALNNIGRVDSQSIYPFFAQTTAPTSNLRENTTCYWYDTDDNYMYQMVKSYGTVYYVNMTTTI